MKPKERPSVFAPQISAALQAAAPSEATVMPSATPARGEAEMFRTSVYLSRAVHDKLREIAFHERRKVHDLFMDGIDRVLAEHGYPTSDTLRHSAKAS